MSNTKDLEKFYSDQVKETSSISEQNIKTVKSDNLENVLKELIHISDTVASHRTLLTERMQEIYFGEKGKETYWLEYNIIELLSKLFGNLENVKEFIEKNIIKPLESVIEAIKTIEKLLELYSSFIISLLSPWIIFLRAVLRAIKELISELFNLFSLDILGGSIKIARPDLPLEPNSIKVNYQNLLPLLNKTVTEWPNRPTSNDSIHCFIFVPYSLIGFANKYSGTLLNNIQEVIDDSKKIFNGTALEKYNSLKSDILKPINSIAKKIDHIEKDLYSFISQWPFRNNDEVSNYLDTIDFKGLLDEYQENTTGFLKKNLELDSANSKIIVSSVVNGLHNKGLLFNNCQALNSSEIFLERTKNPRILIKLNPKNDTGILIHKIYLSIKNLTGNEEINETEEIYINTKSLPLQAYKIIENNIEKFKKFINIYKEYSNEKYIEPPNIITAGTKGSISNIISKISDSILVNNEDFITFMLLRELVLGGITNDEYQKLLREKGLNINYSSYLETAFSYKTRYFLSNKNPTPYDLAIDINKIKNDKIRNALIEINNEKSNRQYKVYIAFELVNGDSILFDDDFYDRNIDTISLDVPGWYIGSIYGYKNNYLYVCEITKRPVSVFTTNTTDRWYGYEIIPSESLESLLGIFWPEGVRIIKESKGYIYESIDYIDNMLTNIESITSILAGILNDISGMLESLRLDFLTNILNLIRSLTFEDLPLVLFGIWEGDVKKMPYLIWSGLQEKGLTTSTKGGIILYAELVEVLLLLQFIEIKDKIKKKTDQLTNKLTHPTEVSSFSATMVLDSLSEKSLPTKTKKILSEYNKTTKQINAPSTTLSTPTVIYDNITLSNLIKILDSIIKKEIKTKENQFSNIYLKSSKPLPF